MNDSTKIRDFLNELIAAQPEIADLLNNCVLANQAIIDRDDIFVRRNIIGEDVVTVTGIITAISRKYGEAISSIYDNTDGNFKLVGFGLYSDNPEAYPPIPKSPAQISVTSGSQKETTN